MSADRPMYESPEPMRSFRGRLIRRTAWSVAAACLLLSGYVATYWSLHWMMYRQWTTGNGFDRQMSKVIRTPGDLYAGSDLPGSHWFDQRKREWQRRGRRAYEEERHANSVDKQIEQLQLIYAEIDRRRSEQRQLEPDGNAANTD